MSESSKLAGTTINSVPSFDGGALPVADRIIVRARNAGVKQSEQPVDLRQAALEGDRASVQRNRSSVSDGAFNSDDSGLRARAQQDLYARQRRIEEAVKLAAREEADKISIRDGIVDAQHLQRRLRTIAQAHNISEAETALVVELFQKTFDSRRQERFDSELGWFERQYYRAKGWISRSLSSIAEFASSIWSDVAEMAKGAAAICKAAKDAAEAVASKEGREKIMSGLRAAKNAVFSKEFWKRIGTCCSNIVKGVFNPETWKGICRAIGGFATGLARFGCALVTDPAKAWEMGVAALRNLRSFATDLGKMAWNGLKTLGSSLANIALAVINDPWKALAYVGKLALELTGLPSLRRMLLCAARGDWSGVLTNGVNVLLCWGALAATVGFAWGGGGVLLGMVTGRMALQAGARQVVTLAAEKFLGKAAEQLGAMAVRQLEKNVGREVLQKTLKNAAAEIADQGIRDLGTKVMKEGTSALTHEAVDKVIHQGAKETAERVSRELGVDKVAESLTKDLLRNIDGKSAKALAKEIAEQGLASSKKEALQMAKAVKASLSNTASDGEIAEILTKGMTKHLSEYFETAMKEPFMDRFQKGLLGKLDDELKQHSDALFKAVKEQAEKLGKSVEDLAREYTETAWKAAQKGIREGIEKVVREGTEAAIKAFRGFRVVPATGDSAEEVAGGIRDPESKRRQYKKQEVDEPVKKVSEQKSDDLRKSAQQEAGKVEKVRMAVTKENLDGEQVQEIYEVVGTERRLVGSTTLAEARKAERKAAPRKELV